MKKILNANFLTKLMLMVFILSAIFTVIRIIMAPVDAAGLEPGTRVKTDYVLMLSQSLLGIFAMLMPVFLKRRVGMNLPSTMLVVYAIFLFCAIYLGEVRAFYYLFPQWDAVLHTFSGAALGALGLSLIGFLNRSEAVTFSLSPAFLAIFAFCFAVALGAVWEIFEFAADSILGTNMQKFMLEDGEMLVGQVALQNTMKDLIVDALGALCMSVAGYIFMKSDKNWIEKMQLKTSS